MFGAQSVLSCSLFLSLQLLPNKSFFFWASNRYQKEKFTVIVAVKVEHPVKINGDKRTGVNLLSSHFITIYFFNFAQKEVMRNISK